MRKLTPFGKEVYRKMIDRDMWPKDLANEIGISQVYLLDILTGNKAGKKMSKKIGEFLEIEEGSYRGEEHGKSDN